MQRIVLIFASVLGTALLQSCTSTIALQPPTGALDFGFRGGEGRTVVVASPFLDARDKSRCKKDDHQERRRESKKRKTQRKVPSAHRQLNCNDEPLTWFPQRLTTGLTGADFIVLEDGIKPAAETLQVRGTLHMLEVESVSLMQSVIFEADVHISLEVITASGLRATRSFHTKASVSKMGGGMGTLQEMLDASSNRMIRDMTAAILSLSNRYPGAIAAAHGIDDAWVMVVEERSERPPR